MPDGVTISVDGLSTLVRTMKKAGEDLADLKAANQRAGEVVAAAAQAMAPSRSGRLKGTIRASKTVGRARISMGSAAVPYAMPIHWGWPSRNIEPNPFVSLAAQQTESQWLPQYIKDVEEALAQVKGV